MTCVDAFVRSCQELFIQEQDDKKRPFPQSSEEYKPLWLTSGAFRVPEMNDHTEPGSKSLCFYNMALQKRSTINS